MLRYDCHFCEENVFDVVDVAHLGDMPHSWTCSGCGRQYIGELDDSGALLVYLRGYKRSARVYEETIIKEIEPAAEDLTGTGDEEPEPGTEELEPGTEELELGTEELELGTEEPEPLPDQEPQVITSDEVGKVEEILGPAEPGASELPGEEPEPGTEGLE